MDGPKRHVHYAYMAKKAARPQHFLREWRKYRGFSLEVAASAIGITHATLSRIERGKLPYNQIQLEGLAHLYQCTTAELLSRDPAFSERRSGTHG